MAVVRCPQCNIPLTDEEDRSGVCPSCAATFQHEAPPSDQKPTPPSAQTQYSPLFIGGLCGGIMVFLLVAGVLLNQLTREKPVAEPDGMQAAVQPKPQAARTPRTGSASEEKKISTQEPAKNSNAEPTPEPKQTEAKPKEEVKDKAKDPEPKKAEEIKIAAKKDEAPKLVMAKRPPDLGPALARIPCLPDDAINIDGDLADWKGIPSVALFPLQRGETPKKAVVVPPTQKAYLAYCSKGLLVAVEVVDTSGALENEPRPARITSWPFWSNDAVEIFIDTLNQRAAERGNSSAHQFLAFPFGTQTDDGIMGYESRILGKGRAQQWTILPLGGPGRLPMLRAGKKTPDGWTMEVLIPKSALRLGEFKPGRTFGFELQIDTGTNIYYHWACTDAGVRVSMHPQRWGEIVLAGSDAQIDLLNTARQPVKEFVPGQPVLVRVTDPDAGWEFGRLSKVNVKLRARSGDVKTLVLTERTPRSGVFYGAMITRIRPAEANGAVLRVLEQDSIAVEYMDALRADGRRDVPVQAEFPSKAKVK